MFSVLCDLSVFGEGLGCGKGVEIGMALGVHRNSMEEREQGRKDGWPWGCAAALTCLSSSEWLVLFSYL